MALISSPKRETNSQGKRLLEIEKINRQRLQNWQLYFRLLSEFLPKNKLPFIPKNVEHNAHIFYILTVSPEQRKKLIRFLNEKGIQAVFHYQSLHRAPFWKGKYNEIQLPITEKIAETILRLPLFHEIKKEEIEYIAENIEVFFKEV